jgi:hypothetical protein
MKHIKISTTGQITEIKEINLAALQEGVGGWVQAIDLSETVVLWCNEEGKMINLPHNPYAQELWDEAYGVKTDYIVGDVVITGGTDNEGNTLGLSETDLAEVKKTLEKVALFVEPRVIVY